MGSGLSSHQLSERKIHPLQEKLPIIDPEVLLREMPEFYVMNVEIERADIARLKSSWSLIVEDDSPVFIERKKDPKFEQRTCIIWFFNLFYAALFDAIPESKALFKGSIFTQGHKLVEMMSLCVDLAERDRDTLIHTLTSLAHSHSSLGVLAHYYGKFATILVATLAEVLGATAFYYEIRQSWLKAFSRMLEVLVPVAIADGMLRARNSQAQDLDGGQRSGVTTAAEADILLRQSEDGGGDDDAPAVKIV